MIEGNPNSAVRVVHFEDLQCGDCAAFRRMLDHDLLPRYGSTVAFEGRDYPRPKHECAHAMAAAARFFEEISPSLGLAFRRYLFEELSFITPNSFLVYLSRFAKRHGVSAADAQRSIHDSRFHSLIQQDIDEGVRRGVEKTPTVFVDDQAFIETFTLQDLAGAIDERLP